MDRSDLLLVIAGASVGSSLSFQKLWQKLICLGIALILLFLVGKVREKRLKEEEDVIINGGDENGV